MSSFEKRFGKYAIPNLPLYFIICYAIGYLLQLVFPVALNYLSLNPYYIIYHFQIWRIITWVLLPPGSFSFLTLIVLYFYYSIGRSLEQVWGTYRFNVYMFSGILFTIIGAFLFYAFSFISPELVLRWASNEFSFYFSTYYISMSIFLAFAATFPDMQIYIFFILPIKVKYLAVIYGALLIWQIISAVTTGNPVIAVAIVSSLLNFVIFFLTSRGKLTRSHGQVKRQYEFRRKTQSTGTQGNGRDSILTGRSGPVTRHKCAICGRTDQSNPELNFRFCSKCNGNYEYCEDHLFTHTHVQ